jgi:hypothetical protein
MNGAESRAISRWVVWFGNTTNHPSPADLATLLRRSFVWVVNDRQHCRWVWQMDPLAAADAESCWRSLIVVSMLQRCCPGLRLPGGESPPAFLDAAGPDLCVI